MTLIQAIAKEREYLKSIGWKSKHRSDTGINIDRVVKKYNVDMSSNDAYKIWNKGR